MPWWRRVIGVVITFHIVCFGWILFRASSLQVVGEVLTQISMHFKPEVLLQFVTGYKGVTFLLILGYLFHFTPQSVERYLQHKLAISPFIVQAMLVIMMIFIVAQVKTVGVQPFIYFQF